MSSALQFAKQLIAFNSVSSLSNVDVTTQVEVWLRKFGCDIERVNYVDQNGINKANIIAKLGNGTGGLAYFGHTDVVPADDWVIEEHGPFDPTVRDDRLFGRGSTDMKGSVACMLAAIAQIKSKSLTAPVYFCCTADEEVGMVGAQKVVEESKLYREMVAGQSRAIIGEPTEFDVVYAHKGGCVIELTSHGIASHSSTKEGLNANWAMIPFLNDMKELNEEMESDPKWQNDEFHPPTMTMNLGINDHMHAVNVTPPESICTIYFRQMPGVNADPIIERVQKAAEQHGLDCNIRFRAAPFYIEPQSPFIQDCLKFAKGESPRTVAYGTDGAWFGELKQAVVFGPGSIRQAHTHDEWVMLEDLEHGTNVYHQMIERWCVDE